MWDINDESRDKDSSKQLEYGSVMSETSSFIRQDSSSHHGSQRTTATNLRKSILLLNDKNVTQTPKNLSFKQGPTMTSFNRSYHAHNSDTSFTNISMNATEDYTNIYERTISHTSFLQDSINQVVNPDNNELTISNTALVIEQDPGIEATNGLFVDFYNCLKDMPTDFQVFELTEKYEECCSDQLKILLKLLKLAPPGEKIFSRTFSIWNMLKSERNTWRLVRALYQDRTHAEMSSIPDETFANNLGANVSDRTIIENLFQNSSAIRQSQLVIDWLEKNAIDQHDVDIQMEYFVDNYVPWENTLHFLKKQKSNIKFSSTRPIVTNMDPDAPIRQNRPLHDLDKEDDARMFKLVFSNIRCGSLEKAQELCMKCGQPWLAAALEGWRLSHDPNYQSTEANQVIEDPTGNCHRDSWKSACWNLADDERLCMHERAIYAAHSGNLKVLLNVCSSWEDYLWAYLRVNVDLLVEQELRDNGEMQHDMDSLPESFWSKRLSIKQLFEEIEASSSNIVKNESSYFYHVIQKYIVVNDISGLIEHMHEYIKNDINSLSKHVIRFMAHLVLFLKSIGKLCKEELCESILKAYVEDLIEDKRSPLVSFYVSTLPDNQQVYWYAKFLEGVTNKEEQKLCLGLAREADLDIETITKTVVENIRSKGINDIDRNILHARTTPQDEEKIKSLDWLMFDECQRAEAVKQANAFIRVFIVCKKMDAARAVFKKIPLNSIDIMFKQCLIKTGQNELSVQDDNATREYFCFQAYLQAHDAFDDWFKHFNHSKPNQPKLSSNATFAELVAYEHQLKQYESELDRWHHSLTSQTELVKDRMYNVLLFVDGGWMIDRRQPDTDEDRSRADQMGLLRKMCIPQICSLLHSVLHQTELYKEALQLADIVSSEQYQLYNVFSNQELKQFLGKIKESSLASLDGNLDTLGYPID